MGGMQLADPSPVSILDIPSTAPTSSDGTDLSATFAYLTMRPAKWLVVAVVTVAPSDLFFWGEVAFGNPDDPTDDKWALHNDRYGRIVGGKLGSALAIGKHSFIVTEMAIYTRVFFQKTAGTVDVHITPIFTSERSS